MWYAVVENATGRLRSVGSVLADPMPSEFEVVELGENFDFSIDKEWDSTTKTFVQSQMFERLYKRVLTYKPWIAALSPTQQQDLKDLVYELLMQPVL